MKKVLSYILIIFAVCILMGNSSCEVDNEVSQSTNKISSIQAKDQEATAKNFKRLFKVDPPPQLTQSLERKQLIQRLNRFNVGNKISYIYLISFGKVMAYYPMKGKVSSVNSMLTCTEQLVDDGQGRYNGRGNVHTLPSPDLDGSYGSNGDGIFFFTTEDVYVEWNGEYMLCDQPLKLSTPPELVYQKQIK